MPRRPVRDRVKCAKPECNDYAHYEYDSQKERVEAAKRRREHPYRCIRHSAESEVLSPENVERTGVLTAEKSYYRSYDGTMKALDGLFWKAEGFATGSGIATGPGFRAFADDFPEGTRLVITARIHHQRRADA